MADETVLNTTCQYDDAAEQQAIQWGRRGARVYYLIEE